MIRSRKSWGATLIGAGLARFRVWAPIHELVCLRLLEHREDIPMFKVENGWHEVVTPLATHGSRYWFVLPNGEHLPDPASRYQPLDVAGPSEFVDLSRYRWQCHSWQGRPWHEAVIYELHVGAFTAEGTFGAVIDKLSHLADMGVTALEIMPVNDFPGKFNWGYDGVLHFAPDATYGRPEDLQRLIDAAHQAGLMVLLDVVYNHFGPHGNRLATFGPEFFTDRHQTPWGAGINFDGDDAGPVRQFFIDNALYWLEEFRLDGLRFDAVHAIADNSDQHIIEAIATVLKERIPDRKIHLIMENEHNEAHRLTGHTDTSGKVTAQWNDDIHHVLHTAVTGDTSGYYADFQGDAHKLARALAEGFAFQGEVMQYSDRTRGEPSASLPPTAFIAFMQNHDQIGNRAYGDRLVTQASADALRAVTAIHLLLPQIPLIFMGEEWGETQPFPFFCDFQGELAEAVRTGRREEFARFPEFAQPETCDNIPDPTSPDTFASAKLRWGDIDHAEQRTFIDLFKMLLAIRSREVIPRLSAITCGGKFEVMPSGAIQITWRSGSTESLTLVANLQSKPAPYTSVTRGRVIWEEGDWDDGLLSPWFVQWSIGNAA